jgi:hypothetical protein
MDPTHFLASQAIRRHDTDKTSQAEIEQAFYDLHGWDWFARLSRWRARLSAAWRRIHNRQNQPVGFAPQARRG